MVSFPRPVSVVFLLLLYFRETFQFRLFPGHKNLMVRPYISKYWKTVVVPSAKSDAVGVEIIEGRQMQPRFFMSAEKMDLKMSRTLKDANKLFDSRCRPYTFLAARFRSAPGAIFVRFIFTILAVMLVPSGASAIFRRAPPQPPEPKNVLRDSIQELISPGMRKFSQGIYEQLPPVDALPKLLGQLVVALVAYRASTIVAGGVRGYCIDNHMDVTTAVFLAELLRYGTLLLASIILFQAFGIQTPQSFTAIVTSLTLAVGLSFQSVLSNFAAGVMLLVFRPYSVGDKVKIGSRVGFVYDISLLATRVDTEDNVRIQVPNSQILNGVVENYTLNPLRRVEVFLMVSPTADVRRTKEVIQACIASFAYLSTAGSTGPAKEKHLSNKTHTSSAEHSVHHTPSQSAAGEGADGLTSSWGGRALSNLFRRQGNQWITPAELMKGLAEQYNQLWKIANGQFRLQLVDVAVKKAPGPEVVLREITPIGLRWQARVWAPSRRYTAVLYQLTESLAMALADADIPLAAVPLHTPGLALGYHLAAAGLPADQLAATPPPAEEARAQPPNI